MYAIMYAIFSHVCDQVGRAHLFSTELLRRVMYAIMTAGRAQRVMIRSAVLTHVQHQTAAAVHRGPTSRNYRKISNLINRNFQIGNFETFACAAGRAHLLPVEPTSTLYETE